MASRGGEAGLDDAPLITSRTRAYNGHQYGPVAQLGARVNGIHEVAGSIPAWSTTFLDL